MITKQLGDRAGVRPKVSASQPFPVLLFYLLEKKEIN
jgi:hypothetical protein